MFRFTGKRIDGNNARHLLITEPVRMERTLHKGIEQSIAAVIGHCLEAAIVENRTVDFRECLTCVCGNICIVDIGCSGKIRFSRHDALDQIA